MIARKPDLSDFLKGKQSVVMNKTNSNWFYTQQRKALLRITPIDIHTLYDAAGSNVLIILADPSDFEGEKAPVEVQPDQSTLLGADVLVQHSDADGSHGGGPI